MVVPNAALVTLVFSDRHPGSYVRNAANLYPDCPVYVAHADGNLIVTRGRTIEKLHQLRAKRVVWVGIPAKWVGEQLDPNSRIKSHFVGTGGRFINTRNTLTLQRTVESAIEAIEKDQGREAAEIVREQEQAIEACRKRALGEPAPWYIPPFLQ